MDAFARCFLLVFAQLAVGGFMALTVPPFHELERGFYKSSASVYLGSGVLATAGLLALLFRLPEIPGARLVEAVAWVCFCGSASLYVATLWGERVALRARGFLFTLLTGVIALTISALLHRTAGAVEAILYPINFAISALLLGGFTCGMMLGHWYLIDPGLSIDPIMSVLRLCVWALALQIGVGLLTVGAFWVLGAPSTAADVQRLFAEHAALLAVRISAGPIAALILAAMIWRTLLVPQTMAATGLFYIASLAALVGEMLGRFILFRTSLPL